MPFKLVVCDFDGTLADSLPTAVGIFNRLAPEMGFRPLVSPTLRTMVQKAKAAQMTNGTRGPKPTPLGANSWTPDMASTRRPRVT